MNSNGETGRHPGSGTGPDDQALRDDLAALSRAYRGADHADHDEPPRALDDAIRAAARRSVNSRPRSLRKSWLMSWSPALAAAAVVVLSVSLSLISLNERPDLAPEKVQEAFQPKPSAQPAQSVPRAAEAPAAQPEAKQKVEIARRDIGALSATNEMSQSTRAPALAAPAAPLTLPPAPPAAKIVSPSVASGSVSPATRNEPLPFPAEPAAVADKRDAMTALEKKVEAQSAALLNSQSFELGALRARSTAQAAAVAAPAMDTLAESVTRSAPAKPAAPEAAPAAARSNPGTAGSELVNQSGTLGGFALDAAVQEGRKERAVAGIAGKPGDAKPAQEWIREILELRRAGRMREANEELGKFRKRHPDYVLPEELREAARE